MPFNTSAIFERLYSWVVDRDGGIKILAQKVDDETNGIVDGINSLMAGEQKFRGPLRGVSGTAANPAFTFDGDTDTGVYRPTANVVGVSVGGEDVARFNASAMSMSKPIAMSGHALSGLPVGSGSTDAVRFDQISGFAKLAGGNTWSGLQTFNGNTDQDINGTGLRLLSDGTQNRVGISFIKDGVAQWNIVQRTGGDLDFVSIGGGNLKVGGNGVATINVNISAGAGLSGGGSLAADRTISMGTPSDITRTSGNTASGSTHTHRITQANFRDMLANFTAAGQIGSYVFGDNDSGATKSLGDTILGSNLYPVGEAGASDSRAPSSLSGTWVCMGHAPVAYATLWMRIS